MTEYREVELAAIREFIERNGVRRGPEKFAARVSAALPLREEQVRLARIRPELFKADEDV